MAWTELDVCDLGRAVLALRARSEDGYVLVRDHFERRTAHVEYRVSIRQAGRHVTAASQRDLLDACCRLLRREPAAATR